MQPDAADLMVIDMVMPPGIDGLETFRRIREIHPRQKAIIASGYAESERVNAMQARGAGAYIRKPYTLEKNRDRGSE
jgi:two-component system, cell cycle sensor histidine kinase and response regulator CckA